MLNGVFSLRLKLKSCQDLIVFIGSLSTTINSQFGKILFILFIFFLKLAVSDVKKSSSETKLIFFF